MIRRRQEIFLFAFILTTRAACDPSPSLYEIQAYKFGGAIAPPPPPPTVAAATDSSPSEQDPEVNLEFDSLEGKANETTTAPIEETDGKTTNSRSPLKVLRQSAASSTVEPTLSEDAGLYYEDLNKGGDAEAEAAAAAAAAAPVWGEQNPTPSPHHFGPIEDEFLPVVGGIIDLEHLEPTAGATTVSREEEADADTGGRSGYGTGKIPGSNTETKNATSTRVPPTTLDFYYKHYYTTTSSSDSASATHDEEEGYYYKPFSTLTTSSPTALQKLPTTPMTTATATAAATTTTTRIPRPTLLQKILDGEFNFFNDPVANWITFFTAAGVFFQLFATPFGQVTTGRRRRRKKRVERRHYDRSATRELWCLVLYAQRCVGQLNSHCGPLFTNKNWNEKDLSLFRELPPPDRYLHDKCGDECARKDSVVTSVEGYVK